MHYTLTLPTQNTLHRTVTMWSKLESIIILGTCTAESLLRLIVFMLLDEYGHMAS